MKFSQRQIIYMEKFSTDLLTIKELPLSPFLISSKQFFNSLMIMKYYHNIFPLQNYVRITLYSQFPITLRSNNVSVYYSIYNPKCIIIV